MTFYLATLRRSRIDGTEVTQAIGIFNTAKEAREALDSMMTYYNYSVLHAYEEGNGFIFYFIRGNGHANVCAGKITEMDVGTIYCGPDHL